jgi:hypothetical protein
MASCRVLGQSFELELPYEEGSMLTASEAAELNRLRVARIVERARAIIRSRGPGADPEEVRRELEMLARDYRFTSPPFVLPPDPAEVEALKIAKAIVQERLAKLPPEANAPSAAELYEVIKALASESRVRVEASRRVELTRKVARDTLGALDDFLTIQPPKDET